MTDVQPANDTDRTVAGQVRLGTPSTRRGLLAGAGAIGAGVLLSACSTEDPNATNTNNGAGGNNTGGRPVPAGSADPGSRAGTALTTVADVPVGGGIILADMVITQPTEGEFKAFSAVCTHQGCVVESSSEGEIPCPCHASRFSLADGSPTSGPASAPLEAVQITVDGDSIALA